MASSSKLLDDCVIKKRFAAAKSSQESIQQTAEWMFKHKQQCHQIVNNWLVVIKASKSERKLTLFYVCNEVLQTCKRKGALVYKEAFVNILQDATTYVKEIAIVSSVERIFRIWLERNVLPAIIINTFISSLYSESVELASSFKLNDLVDSVKNMKKLDIDLEVKRSAIININLDMTSQQIAKLFKDRQQGKALSTQIEDCKTSILAYMHLNQQVLIDRKLLMEQVENSLSHYEAQYEEARIVVNAYKNFGSRIRHLRGKLQMRCKLLPPPRVPPIIVADTQLVDMDLSDDDDDDGVQAENKNNSLEPPSPPPMNPTLEKLIPKPPSPVVVVENLNSPPSSPISSPLSPSCRPPSPIIIPSLPTSLFLPLSKQPPSLISSKPSPPHPPTKSPPHPPTKSPPPPPTKSLLIIPLENIPLPPTPPQNLISSRKHHPISLPTRYNISLSPSQQPPSIPQQPTFNNNNTLYPSPTSTKYQHDSATFVTTTQHLLKQQQPPPTFPPLPPPNNNPPNRPPSSKLNQPHTLDFSQQNFFPNCDADEADDMTVDVVKDDYNGVAFHSKLEPLNERIERILNENGRMNEVAKDDNDGDDEIVNGDDNIDEGGMMKEGQNLNRTKFKCQDKQEAGVINQQHSHFNHFNSNPINNNNIDIFSTDKDTVVDDAGRGIRDDVRIEVPILNPPPKIPIETHPTNHITPTTLNINNNFGSDMNNGNNIYLNNGGSNNNDAHSMASLLSGDALYKSINVNLNLLKNILETTKKVEPKIPTEAFDGLNANTSGWGNSGDGEDYMGDVPVCGDVFPGFEERSRDVCDERPPLLGYGGSMQAEYNYTGGGEQGGVEGIGGVEKNDGGEREEMIRLPAIDGPTGQLLSPLRFLNYYQQSHTPQNGVWDNEEEEVKNKEGLCNGFVETNIGEYAEEEENYVYEVGQMNGEEGCEEDFEEGISDDMFFERRRVSQCGYYTTQDEYFNQPAPHYMPKPPKLPFIRPPPIFFETPKRPRFSQHSHNNIQQHRHNNFHPHRHNNFQQHRNNIPPQHRQNIPTQHRPNISQQHRPNIPPQHRPNSTPQHRPSNTQQHRPYIPPQHRHKNVARLFSSPRPPKRFNNSSFRPNNSFNHTNIINSNNHHTFHRPRFN